MPPCGTTIVLNVNLSRRGVIGVPVTILCQQIVTQYRIIHKKVTHFVSANCNTVSDYTQKSHTFLEWMLKPCSRFLLQQLRVLRLQEITRILRNPNFGYRFQNRPLLAPILSHMNPLHAHPSHSLKIPFKIILPSTPRSSRQSSSRTLTHQVLVWTCICHAPLIIRPIYSPWIYYHKICSAEYK
jgi:hypothetical protein